MLPGPFHPRVGITMGDPAGIGPEIVLKVLADGQLSEICSPVVIGDAQFLEQTARNLQLPFNFLITRDESDFPAAGRPIIFDLGNIEGPIALAVSSVAAGKASADYIETAARLCLDRKLDAMATAPINKISLALGGYSFPGHTEFLASITGTDKFAMSFFAGDLRVVLLSIHLSLRDALDLVTRERIRELILFSDKEMARLLRRPVKIAVAGLNPHASEGGRFGGEEAAEITPAINDCIDKGINVSGPYSPDTIFLRAFKGEFDAVISCYHDQATIAVKCLSFGESVNVTLGLPIIRTSVDHGTAYEIAGRNLADASSMRAAVKLAARLAGSNS
jgi:4-phospho-D-threonate 3-dehydrogenase / 4-phospho-D-erythronate 3-dehydrogenase